MMKRIVAVLFTALFLLPVTAWATNYTADVNCTAAYLFTEGSGTTVADSSPSANTGTFNASGHPAWSANVPSYAVSGQAAGSVKFNGTTGDLINCTTNDFVKEDQPLTFTCRFNLSSDTFASPEERDWRIFARDDALNFYIQNDVTNSRIGFEVPGASYLVCNFNSTTYLTTNVWHLVILEWAGGMGSTNVTLYFDNDNKTRYYTEEGASPTDNAGEPMILGNVHTGDAAINATMTDIAFFNRLLNETERTEIWNYGLNGAPAVTEAPTGQIIFID